MQALKAHWATVIITIGLLAAVSLPYLYASQAGGQEWVFSGFLVNPLDGNSYLAKMYEGWRGDWLFSLPYTAERGNGSFLFLFYLFLGHTARWLGLSLVLTFHLARLLSTAVLLLALYRFFQALLPEQRLVMPAYALAALGSGLGWLALLFGAFTSDFWVAEAFPFLSAYANPHFPLGLALILWLLAPNQGGSIQAGCDRFISFLASVLLAVVSPFGVVIVVMVLGGLLLFEYFRAFMSSRSVLSSRPQTPISVRTPPPVVRLPLILLGGMPVLLYDLWISRADPLLTAWNAQNVTPSPPIGDLIVSLSPALILALPAAWAVLKKGTLPGRLLLAWFGLSLVLLYLPFGLQRRFMMGLYIPLSGLAVMGIDVLVGGSLRQGIHRKRQILVVSFLFLLALPTNLVILLAARHGVQSHDPNLYLSTGEDLAFRWIERNTPADALILAGPETGLYLPARTGRRVLYGHPFETANARAEKEFILDFFMKGEVEAASLARRGVDFIFWGPREQSLNPDHFLSGQPEVYEMEGVKIYAVASPPALDE